MLELKRKRRKKKGILKDKEGKDVKYRFFDSYPEESFDVNVEIDYTSRISQEGE